MTASILWSAAKEACFQAAKSNVSPLHAPAAKGRTTIAVAHRLSSIQKADMIYVLDQGRIVENGTHYELLRNKGRYYELVNLQSLGKTH